MPAKPLEARPVKAQPTGPFVVINPRNIPKGRHIIREGDKRWFEGDDYSGPKAELWLARGFIKPGKGGK